MRNIEQLVGITTVERETGLGKDVLRAWEKRYGFPNPVRDQRGDRLYSAEQVEKLRLLRHLIDDGLRPGKIVSLSMTELQSLQRASGPQQPAPTASEPADSDRAATEAAGAELAGYIDLLRSHSIEALQARMNAHVMRIGLERFVMEIAAPLTRHVGEAWSRGDLQVFEEHLFTEQLMRILRGGLQSLQAATTAQNRPARPRVLLTTLPGESHGLGLLMAESLMTLHGCSCLSLGLETPLAEIAQGATARKADIIALSFSPWFNTNRLGGDLGHLASLLTHPAEIWLGGTNNGLARLDLPGLRVFRDLSDISPALKQWRERNA